MRITRIGLLALAALVVCGPIVFWPRMPLVHALGACAGYQTLFVGTLAPTTLSGGNNTINYPVGLLARPGESVSLTVDWDDGSSDALYADSATSGIASHTYSNAGTYAVKITGTGVALVPGPCEYPYAYNWSITVEQGISQPSPAPPPQQPTPAFSVDRTSAGDAPDTRSARDDTPPTVPLNPNTPDMIRSVPAPNDLSLDPEVIATNLTFAGVTLLLIFVSAQLFNSTISENRAEIEGFFGRVLAPLRGVRDALRKLLPTGGDGEFTREVVFPLLVLGLTVMIYGFTDPDFGANRPSIVIVASLLLCVGAVTYLVEGGKALYAGRTLGRPMGIRPFPFAIAIAVVNVIIARVIGFSPGVIFGFVGGAIFLRPVTLTHDEEGRMSFAPALGLLALSIVAWLLIMPARDWSDESRVGVGAFFEGAAVAVFVGGVQGIFFSMIPLRFMDGEKVLRWNKAAWFGLAAVSGMLFWHALLNSEESYLDALTSSVTVGAFCVLGGAMIISVLTWGFFRLRLSRPARVRS